MTSQRIKHVKALRLLLMQAPPMLSAKATRSKSLAPLPVSTAASTGEPLQAPSGDTESFSDSAPLKHLHGIAWIVTI